MAGRRATPRWTVLGVVPVIAIVLLAGVALRLVLAFVVFPQSGLWSDIRLFADWSLTLADVGPGGFYQGVTFSDYTPGYLVVLWLFGVGMKTVAQLTGGAAGELIPIWIKLPGILVDVLVAAVFYGAIRRWHGPGMRGERWAVAVAAIYLFVPVTWYDSALWGQVDAIGVLAGGLALIWLIDRRPELAAGTAMAAALLKPQFALFLPIVAIVLLRRTLHRPRHEAGGWRDPEGPVRLLTAALAALAVLLAVVVPFDLETRAPEALAGVPIVSDLAGLVALVAATAGSYDVLTANAFNPWALIGPRPLASAIGGDYTWTWDSTELLGLPASIIGTALFVATALFTAFLLYRRQDRDAILVSAVILATAFFVMPTRVHERYLFAAIGIGVLLLPRARAWWAWFAVAAGIAWVNMHAILSLPFRGYGTPEMRALPLADLSRTWPVVTLVALACIPVMAWPLIDGWRLATRPAEPDPEPGIQPEPDTELVSSGAPEPAPLPAPAGPALVTAEPPPPPAPPPVVRRPILPGRIRPRDLGIAVLIALVLGLVRVAGLDRPLGWYFDEDLHGRTATELLQDWRYGMPHELEEWTHPHLAKYLMAASIETLGGHGVRDTLDLGVSEVRDIAVEPGATGSGGSRARDTRLYAATPDGILVRSLPGDAPALQLEVAPTDRLAMAPDDRVLFAATDDGSLLRIDTSQLAPDAPPTDAPFIAIVAETGAPIDGLWALPGGSAAIRTGDTLTLIGPDGTSMATAAPGLTDVDAVPVADGWRLALSLPDGIHLLDAADLSPIGRVPLLRRPLGADLVDGSEFLNNARDLLPEPRLFVATRGGLVTIGGLDTDAPSVDRSMEMPGPVYAVRWNPSTNLVHVLGEQDGAPTLYVVEPHGMTVFADAALPVAPVGWDLDVHQADPGADRQLALVAGAEGRVAEVGLGGTAFATRLPGALLGGIAGALIWLLLLLLSPRRSAAAIGLVLVATELLLFAQSRIATPDTFTIAFLLAGWTLLAWLLGGADPRAHRWRWLIGLPLVGLLLGLAASTKWTGFYGLAGVLGYLVVLAAWQRLPRHAGRPRILVPWSMVAWGLVAIPVAAAATYVVLYVPWAFLAGGDPQLIAGWPRGHTGELFVDLQARMLAFHDGLREGHPSGSPWWSWPLMLKPLWAYLEGFGDLVGSIVMPANPIVVWASIPVMAWAAWRLLRHGLQPALLLLVVAFAAQWLPWLRVERVTFFYHYATALPFALAALALLLAALRERVSPRGWRAMRVAAITVAFLPAVAWAATEPLCSTLASDPTVGVCGEGWSTQLPVPIALGMAAVVVAIGLVGRWLMERGAALPDDDPEARGRHAVEWAIGLAVVLGVAMAALAIGRTGLLGEFQLTIGSPLLMGVIAALIALPIAVLAATARSPRTLVAGTLLAAVTLAALLLPTVVAIPVPASVASVTQALLPTADSAFVFTGGASGGLPAALVILGVPLAAIATVAWLVVREIDRRTPPEG